MKKINNFDLVCKNLGIPIVFIRKIEKSLKKFNGKIYIVGGNVRDLILNKSIINHPDLVVNLDLEKLLYCLEKAKIRFLKIGEKFGSIVVLFSFIFYFNNLIDFKDFFDQDIYLSYMENWEAHRTNYGNLSEFNYLYCFLSFILFFSCFYSYVFFIKKNNLQNALMWAAYIAFSPIWDSPGRRNGHPRTIRFKAQEIKPAHSDDGAKMPRRIPA